MCVSKHRRQRGFSVRRLETDLPFLALAWGTSVARCGGARPGTRIPPADEPQFANSSPPRPPRCSSNRFNRPRGFISP